MIDSISWYIPGISFSKDGIFLFEPWGPFKIDNFPAACNQKSYLVIVYCYPEFVIQVRPTNHGNWKICDKLGHYLHQGDPVLVSPMAFSSFHKVVIETGHLAFSF